MIEEDVWVDIAKWFLMAKEDRARKVAVTFVRVTDREELTRAGRRVEARGFPYTVGGEGEKGEIYGSMTAGGIASLCIARDVLRTIGSRHMRGRLAKDLREAIDGGWGWFAEHWCIQRHPVTRGRGWCHYYLYALERAGVFSGLLKIDNRDWYAEGAEWLIETQEPDGHWILESGGVHSTCFALLFLKRGTVPVTTGD
jgi:hypothetical protein